MPCSAVQRCLPVALGLCAHAFSWWCGRRLLVSYVRAMAVTGAAVVFATVGHMESEQLLQPNVCGCWPSQILVDQITSCNSSVEPELSMVVRRKHVYGPKRLHVRPGALNPCDTNSQHCRRVFLRWLSGIATRACEPVPAGTPVDLAQFCKGHPQGAPSLRSGCARCTQPIRLNWDRMHDCQIPHSHCTHRIYCKHLCARDE